MALDEKLELNRWCINKLGVVNYWFYDEEEFEFSDGRMILRGENGSGKSVTMQAFIPLLLDGNRSPERLDSFGSKAKKIEDYVLGYGEFEKEENISYLYLEFKKKETNNYITVGIGLNAKKGKPTSFYGFAIKDSRRIGKDILLYKSKDNKIPLTKLELKNLLGQGGILVETSKEYMELVNNLIFGFESTEEYSEFIKLIIDVRKPKLSKDGYKPSDITKIMSDSLRSLTDEDLRPVSESIENMNKTKEQLEILYKSDKALSKIIKHYDKYNSCVIYNKANTFIEINKKYDKIVKQEKELEKEITNLQNQVENYSKELETNQNEYEIAKTKNEELSKSEIYAKKDELLVLKDEIEKLEKNIKEKQEQLSNKKNIQEKKKQEFNDKELEKYNLEKQLKDKSSEILQLSEDFKFDSFAFSNDEIFSNANLKYNYEPLKREFKMYQDNIKKILASLEKQKEKENEYDRELKAYDSLSNKLIEQDKLTDKSRNYLNSVKEELVEKIYSWEKDNQILKIQDKNRSDILTNLSLYGESKTFDDIIQILRLDYNIKNDEIKEERHAKEIEKKEIEESIEKINIEIYDWKTQKEPEPYRSEAVISNRNRLREKNIKFSPLYQIIDYKKHVAETDKALFESALLDMGLLDALVIDKNDLEKVLKLDNEFVDKYIVSKPGMMQNDTSSLFDIVGEDIKINKEADEILRSVLLYNNDSVANINENGFYQNGILRGKVSNDYQAKFIGTLARKKYKNEQIECLELQKLKLLERKKELQEVIDELKIKLNILNEEFVNFPKKDDIETAYSMLREAILKSQTIKEDITQKEEMLKRLAGELKKAKEEALELSHNMYLKLTYDTYQVAYDSSLEFEKLLLKFEIIHNNIINIYENMQVIADYQEETLLAISDLSYELEEANTKLNTNITKYSSIEKLINSDYKEIEQEIEECKEKLKILPKLKDELLQNISATKTALSYKNEEVVKINKDILLKEKLKDISYDIFREEANLNYVLLKDEENNEMESSIKDYTYYINLAVYVITKYNSFSKDINDTNYYLDNLMANYRDNSSELNEYNITRQELFTKQADEYKNEEIDEIKNVASSYIRKDLKGFFKGKNLNINELSIQIKDTITEMNSLIEEDDRELFEDILTNTIGNKIRRKIYDAKAWIKNINLMLETIDSKITFSFNWKAKNAENDEQMDTKELVDILKSEASLLREEEIEKVSRHFRNKIEKAEQRLDEQGNIKSFHTLMKETLDYREWFEFEFYYIKQGEQKRELTNNAFFKLSGGEKAMAMYIPLFAAVNARLEAANKDAVRIIALDEAFAGVDEKNIGNMFSILTELKIDYVINSQILWGDYETIPSIAIYQLIKSNETRTVAVTKYLWNGKVKKLIK